MPETIAHSRFADLYDTYVRTEIDIPFFLEEAGQVEGDVLELMSGTGRISIPLLEAGVRLTCVDYSAEMLAVLKEKLAARGLSAAVHQMDVRLLALDKSFGLALIPFNSFAELISPYDRQEALDRIYAHLIPGGRLICTLHNPAVRLKRVDGQLRLWGNFPFQDRGGKLLLWGLETLDSQQPVVQGLQLYEEYDEQGVMCAKRLLETRFAVIDKAEFEESARAAGFEIVSLYGDYARSEFDREASPFMIWVLRKRLNV